MWDLNSSDHDGDRDRDTDRGNDRDKETKDSKEKDKNEEKAKKPLNGASSGLDLFSKLAAINARVTGTPAVAAVRVIPDSHHITASGVPGKVFFFSLFGTLAV